jgi:hypothetical protein
LIIATMPTMTSRWNPIQRGLNKKPYLPIAVDGIGRRDGTVGRSGE